MANETTAPETAAPTATHPHFAFHVNLGQIMGLALLGLQAYNQQDVAPGGAAVLLDPATALPYMQGVLSLFPPAPPAVSA